jgi:hypothetical protein
MKPNMEVAVPFTIPFDSRRILGQGLNGVVKRKPADAAGLDRECQLLRTECQCA